MTYLLTNKMGFEKVDHAFRFQQYSFCPPTDSGGRALGAIYFKFKYSKGLGFKTYTKMYNSGTTPILDYCSGFWGFSKFYKIDTVQNRAIRLFLGVHRFALNDALNRDMGWMGSVRRKGGNAKTMESLYKHGRQ